ncbi:hypothetical protein [Pseudolactococcus reticulitermitis]|nr:hypothetical protein [Lactococcus reticulitermitis]
MDKLAEVNSVMLAVFGISFFGSIRSLTKALLRQQDKRQQEKELLKSSFLMLKDSQLAILHNKIYTNCGEFLEAGYISIDDLDDLNYLFNAYKSLGGNGTGETLYNKVVALPNKNEGR